VAVVVMVVVMVMALEFLSFVRHLDQDLFGDSERIRGVMVGVCGVIVFLVVSVVVLSLFPHINIKMIILINHSKIPMPFSI
jgi:hypothetical protein